MRRLNFFKKMFFACFSLDFMYEDYISEDLHGMIMKYIELEQGSQGNQDYFKSQFKTAIKSQHFILQHFLVSYQSD